MISNCISDDITPYMNISNMVITLLMHLTVFVYHKKNCLKLEPCNTHKAACNQTKCDVIKDVKLFQTI